MIIEEIKNINSGKKELRKFGITVGLVLIAIGFIFQLAWYNYTVYIIVGSIGAFLLLAGILFPNILLPIQKVWMAIAVLLGFVMTRVILSFLFYVVVTLVGFTAKLAGKDFLDRKIDKSAKSYWNKREKTDYTKELTERQF